MENIEKTKVTRTIKTRKASPKVGRNPFEKSQNENLKPHALELPLESVEKRIHALGETPTETLFTAHSKSKSEPDLNIFLERVLIELPREAVLWQDVPGSFFVDVNRGISPGGRDTLIRKLSGVSLAANKK